MSQTNHIRSVSLLHEKYPTHNQYPYMLPVFNHTKQLTLDTPVTLFVGENGSGKSTLLEALARKCGIHIWCESGGTRCEVNPYEKTLHQCLSVEWADGGVPGAFFGSELFNNFRHIVESWAATDPGQLRYFGGQSLVSQSHGQSMMSYFRSRYQIKGLYLLDEPETALSPRSQLELLEILRENGQAGHAQFIIATHSPLILSCEGAKIYSFDHQPVRVVEYEDTELYQAYKRFFVDRLHNKKV